MTTHYQTKEDRDRLLKAVNEEFTWEYHPFLPLERHMGPQLKPEIAVLYRPTLVPDQMWLFPKIPIEPIATLEMRVAGGTMVILGHNAEGVRYLFEQGWVLAGNALRVEKKTNAEE